MRSGRTVYSLPRPRAHCHELSCTFSTDLLATFTLCSQRFFIVANVVHDLLDLDQKLCSLSLQALQRIKATPGFIARASVAHEEYLAQMEDADRAVHSFCELHGHADRMTWRHRPDLQQAWP